MGRALTRGGSCFIVVPPAPPVRGGMDRSSSIGPALALPSGLTMLPNPAAGRSRSSPEPDVLRMTGVSSWSMGGRLVEARLLLLAADVKVEEAAVLAEVAPPWWVRKGRPGPVPRTSLRSRAIPPLVGVLWSCRTSCRAVVWVPPAGGETLAASGEAAAALDGLSLRDGPADSMPPPLPPLSESLAKLLTIRRPPMRPAMASGEVSSPTAAGGFADGCCCDILNLVFSLLLFLLQNSRLVSYLSRHELCSI
mmetsp:Transcript_25108/g.72620  ORF Transcript_25108/g.72620 Transcript_25108/m.72620 type:complete len:251 (+) Transcript_25108:277-1029(+)